MILITVAWTIAHPRPKAGILAPVFRVTLHSYTQKENYVLLAWPWAGSRDYTHGLKHKPVKTRPSTQFFSFEKKKTTKKNKQKQYACFFSSKLWKAWAEATKEGLRP